MRHQVSIALALLLAGPLGCKHQKGSSLKDNEVAAERDVGDEFAPFDGALASAEQLTQEMDAAAGIPYVAWADEQRAPLSQDQGDVVLTLADDRVAPSGSAETAQLKKQIELLQKELVAVSAQARSAIASGQSSNQAQIKELITRMENLEKQVAALQDKADNPGTSPRVARARHLIGQIASGKAVGAALGEGGPRFRFQFEMVNYKGILIDGVKITSVTPGGPADRAGIRAGDLISSMGGWRISSTDDVDAVRAEVDKIRWPKLQVIVTRLDAPDALKLLVATGY